MTIFVRDLEKRRITVDLKPYALAHPSTHSAMCIRHKHLGHEHLGHKLRMKGDRAFLLPDRKAS